MNGNRVTKQIAKKAIENSTGLFFDKFVHLDIDAAELLVQEFADLHLDGLQDLNEELATTLAGHSGMLLSLNGVRELEPPVASAIAQYRGLLLLNGIEQLTPEIAEPLASHLGGVALCGVRSVDVHIAKCFAEKHESLSLDGLTEISPSISRHLIDIGDADDIDPVKDELAYVMQSPIGRRSLSLSGLVKLNPDVAQVLAQHRGMLILNGLQSIDLETATILAGGQSTLLALDGLPSIESEVEQVLRAFTGTLSVDMLDGEDED